MLIPQSGKGIVDLNESGIYTKGVEQCLAIAARDGSKGALCHMTQREDPSDYLNWLAENMSKDSHVYLIGGQDDSQAYVCEVAMGLAERQFHNLDAQEVLGNLGRDVTMKNDGISVRSYRLIRRGSNLEPVTVAVSRL